MQPGPQESIGKLHAIGKVVIGSTWLLATACFFPPLESARLGEFGRTLFGVLAVPQITEGKLIDLRTERVGEVRDRCRILRA